MNAITFLRKEHDKMRKMMREINKKSRRYTTKKTMFKTLCKDLTRHESLEQKIWYPHFKNSKKIKSEVKHLLSEEKHAEKEIKKFKMAKTEEEWNKKFAQFKHMVEHHAHEEERKLFPVVKAILNKNELEEIGKEMRMFMSKFKRKHSH